MLCHEPKLFARFEGTSRWCSLLLHSIWFSLFQPPNRRVYLVSFICFAFAHYVDLFFSLHLCFAPGCCFCFFCSFILWWWNPIPCWVEWKKKCGHCIISLLVFEWRDMFFLFLVLACCSSLYVIRGCWNKWCFFLKLLTSLSWNWRPPPPPRADKSVESGVTEAASRDPASWPKLGGRSKLIWIYSFWERWLISQEIIPEILQIRECNRFTGTIHSSTSGVTILREHGKSEMNINK